MDLKRGTQVEIHTLGYEGRRGAVERKAVPSRDGVERFYIVFKGSFSEIAFRIDEFKVIPNGPAAKS
jgi:hypothetical protein